MSGRQKILAYATGFLLGCIILMMLPREREQPRRHPWHAQTAPDGTYPMTVVDDTGRTVRLEKQPRHFISLAPSVTEILFAMGMGDHLVAVTQWCEWPEEARALRDGGAQVGAIDQPDRERIAAYQPDLILGSDLTPPEIYAAIERPPRTVAVAFRHESMDDIIADIGTIGRITGVPGKALELVTRLRAERARIDQAVAPHRSQPPRRVLMLLSIEEGGQPGWAPGSNTWVGSLIEAAHGENCAARLGGSWGEVSLEALLALDPQVVLVRDGETPAEQAALRRRIDELAAHPVWRQVAAVRGVRVHILPHGPLNIPGPRVMEAYAAIAAAVWAD